MDGESSFLPSFARAAQLRIFSRLLPKSFVNTRTQKQRKDEKSETPSSLSLCSLLSPCYSSRSFLACPSAHPFDRQAVLLTNRVFRTDTCFLLASLSFSLSFAEEEQAANDPRPEVDMDVMIDTVKELGLDAHVLEMLSSALRRETVSDQEDDEEAPTTPLSPAPVLGESSREAPLEEEESGGSRHRSFDPPLEADLNDDVEDEEEDGEDSYQADTKPDE